MSMFKSKAIIGIDIDTSYIKVVKKRINGQVIQWMVELIPDDLIQDGRIVSEKALSLFIRKKLKKAKIQEKKCGVCLSLNQVIVREFHFPVMVKEFLDKNVRYEIAEYLPLGIDKYVVDYRILNEKNSLQQNFLQVMVVAIPKDILESCIKVLRQAGLRPVIIDVPVNCQERWYDEYICNLGDFSFKQRNVCIIDIGAYSTRFTLLNEGVYFIDKVSTSIKNQNQKIDIDILIEEIADVLNFFYNRKPGQKVHNILIVGNGVRVNGLPEQIEERLEIPVSLISMDNQYGIYLPNAIGAAIGLERINNENKIINFITAKKDGKPMLSNVLTAIFVILIAIGVGILGFWIPIRDKYNLIQKVEALQIEKDKYKDILNNYQELKNEVEALKGRKLWLDQVISQQKQLSHILNVIDRCLPIKAHIFQISTDQNTIQLRGRADDDMTVAQLLIALSETGEFDNVLIEEIALEQTTGLKLFSIKCNVRIYNDLNQGLHAENE